MVSFGGYLLPVEYKTGVLAEHMAVRKTCGLFDASHMGEIICSGRDALGNLNRLLTNDFSNLAVGRARYSPMCNEQGGVVDDLIVYKTAEDSFLIVVNASNKDKDFAWMQDHKFGDVRLKDVSEDYALIAVQGPNAYALLSNMAQPGSLPDRRFAFNASVLINDIACMVARTGYTGEDGFEIYLKPKDAESMWNLLLEYGRDLGVVSCGLGSRDTLRLEASLPLYGHELDVSITPLEAGLGRFVKMEKPDFIGKSALQADIKRKLVGLKVTGRGIIREHMQIFADEREIGFSTSGTHCPFLGAPYAMALVDKDYSALKTPVEADVRGRRVTAEVVPLPFYQR